MTRQVRVFSIQKERARRGGGAQEDDSVADQRHREVLHAIDGLRAQIRAGGLGAGEGFPESESEGEGAEEPVATPQGGFSAEQVADLKRELIGIESAIEDTKRELATLHQNRLAGERFQGVTDELDQVVKGTEQATDTILESAEVIENDARNLAAALSRDGDRNMAYEIQEQTVKIFEACNFQDITGQRITKVVNTLRFVEDRVLKMMDIWGGFEAFKNVAGEDMPNPAGSDDMLHGPGDNEGDPDRASQEDIDALFN